ncbi:MAG: hypothetical protein GTN62_11970 [Gemmatimonadales bacterium]|nr:hypothetical protein [Gemmatimonadales bacterium]NIN12436.1 hypothetical protein [Gemmatimonadales bacterium]NIN50812.1 hypothetical protein [Gemmatimonadales bacterium]NIP08276.1 hypothetical protein [Gemmatimonadales bacterium]NIR00800.1 hypothetical protein [Gemmatimonadales bacterium]
MEANVAAAPPDSGGAVSQPRLGVAALDAARARATGPTNKQIDLTLVSGYWEGTIDGLAPGSYTVIVEGLVGGQVDYYGQTSGVEVTAGQNRTASISFSTFRPQLNVGSPTTAFRFRVDWPNVSNATSYEIQWDSDAGFPGPDTRGPFTIPSFDVDVPDVGTYYIRARSSNAQVAAGRWSDVVMVDVVTDISVSGDDPGTAPFLGFGTSVVGTYVDLNIYPSGDEDWFALDACTGDSVLAETWAERLDPMSDVDTWIWLTDSTGTALIDENDDTFGLDSYIETELPYDGRYHLMVFGVGGSVGHYELDVDVITGPANTGAECTGGGPFGGTVSATSGGFADTLVIKPAATLPWNGGEFVMIGGADPWIVDQTLDSIVLLVPNLPVGQDTVWIHDQGPSLVSQFALLDITSSFTRNADPASAPDVAGGPFPMEFFISLSDTSRDHYLTFAPQIPLAATLSLETQTGVDLDIWWWDGSSTRLAGNPELNASTVNPEVSTFAIPADTVWRVQLNLFDTTGTVAEMAKLTIVESPRFVMVSAGTAHTCGVKSGGAAYCWGSNDYGQLGNGTVGIDEPLPVLVSGSHTFKTVSAGHLHTCGVTIAEDVYCWGRNANGQLGNSTITDAATPVAVSGALTFTSVNAGRFHTCAVASGGQAYCWGSNVSGKLGTTLASETCTGVTCSTAPIAIEQALPFASVSAGDRHSCGVRTNGALYTWGGNGWGQLGDGTTTQSTVPVFLALGYRQASAGGLHSCASVVDAPAECWGQNTDGQLGSGTPDSSAHTARDQVSIATPRFLTVSGGRRHTCAVPQLFLGPDSTAYGWIYCWGEGSDGQLGDGLATERVVPDTISGRRLYQWVAAGFAHSCALTNDGLVYCWGRNGDGQLGDGTFTMSSLPVLVSGQPPPAAAASGRVSIIGRSRKPERRLRP